MFDVKAGQASALHVVQTGAAVSRDTPERGTLEITTEPAGLAVAIDRRPAGVSPISVGDLQPGTHEVTITRGTTVLRRTVSVDARRPDRGAHCHRQRRPRPRPRIRLAHSRRAGAGSYP